MLYKFIHENGYEVLIKDIDAFIGYVNTNAINEKTRVYDEVANVGKFAYEVNEFKEIFDTMKRNGWSIYVVPKAVEATSNMVNYGLKDAKNDDDDDRLIINYEVKNNRQEAEVVKKDVSEMTRWTNTQVRLSTNAKMFFGAAATALIFLSFIIIIVATKTLSENDVILNEIAKRVLVSFSIAIVITFFSNKIFFSKKKFVAYLFFAILMFTISAFQYVDSIEKERKNNKKNSIEYNIMDEDYNYLKESKK
ncbi:MAG: hypothetical protein ABF289_17995 [Clostridiales bacterium]